MLTNYSSILHVYMSLGKSMHAIKTSTENDNIHSMVHNTKLSTTHLWIFRSELIHYQETLNKWTERRKTINFNGECLTATNLYNQILRWLPFYLCFDLFNIWWVPFVVVMSAWLDFLGVADSVKRWDQKSTKSQPAPLHNQLGKYTHQKITSIACDVGKPKLMNAQKGRGYET